MQRELVTNSESLPRSGPLCRNYVVLFKNLFTILFMVIFTEYKSLYNKNYVKI